MGEFEIRVLLNMEKAREESRRDDEKLVQREKARREVKQKIERDIPETSPGKPMKQTLGQTLLQTQLKKAARGSPAAQTVMGAAQAAGAARGFAPRFAAGAARVAAPVAVAAGAYAAVSGAGRAAPTWFEFLRGLLPEALAESEDIQGIMDRLEGLRAGLNRFESTFAAAFSALSKSKELGVAGLRITGQMPDVVALYQQTHLADTYINMLDRKAKQERADEVAIGLGEVVRLAVSDSMSGK